MTHRALFTYVLLLAAGCGAQDVCKETTTTCLSITLQPSEGVREVDEVDLWIDGVQKDRSSGSRQKLPMQIAVLWSDGRHSVRLESFLDNVRTGTTAEIYLELSSGMHARQELTPTSMLVQAGDMGTADLSGSIADMTQTGTIDLRGGFPDLSQ